MLGFPARGDVVAGLRRALGEEFFAVTRFMADVVLNGTGAAQMCAICVFTGS